jgi:hypothetical protein
VLGEMKRIDSTTKKYFEVYNMVEENSDLTRDFPSFYDVSYQKNNHNENFFCLFLILSFIILFLKNVFLDHLKIPQKYHLLLLLLLL